MTGITLSIDLSNWDDKGSILSAVSHVCIPCQITILNLHLTEIEKLNSISALEGYVRHRFQTGQHHRGLYLKLTAEGHNDILRSCDISVPSFKPLYFQKRSSVCAFHVLQEKFTFNRPVRPPGHSIPPPQFKASFTHFLSEK